MLTLACANEAPDDGSCLLVGCTGHLGFEPCPAMDAAVVGEEAFNTILDGTQGWSGSSIIEVNSCGRWTFTTGEGCVESDNLGTGGRNVVGCGSKHLRPLRPRRGPLYHAKSPFHTCRRGFHPGSPAHLPVSLSELAPFLSGGLRRLPRRHRADPSVSLDKRCFSW